MPPIHLHVKLSADDAHRIILLRPEEDSLLPTYSGEFDLPSIAHFLNRQQTLMSDVYEVMWLAVSPQYLDEAFGETLPEGWKGIVTDLLWCMLDDLFFTVWSAGVGASFGFNAAWAACPPLWPLGAALGAALGTMFAMWVLWISGMLTIVKGVVELLPEVGQLVTMGIRSVWNGDKIGAAKLFARAFALTVGGVVPMIVLTAFTKGGPAAAEMTKSIRATIVRRIGEAAEREAAWASLLRGLEHINAIEITTPPQAKSIGMKFEETIAFRRFTKDSVYCGRCCSPDRVTAIDAVMADAGVSGPIRWNLFGQKSASFNAIKSIKGRYWAPTEWMNKYLGDKYRMVAIAWEETAGRSVEGGVPTFTVREKATRYRLEATDKAPNFEVPVTRPGAEEGSVTHGYWLDNTNPTEGGPWFDGMILDVGQNEGVDGFFFRTPAGNPVVPDVDRLFYMQMSETGKFLTSGQIKGQRWLNNDDPLEIMYMNRGISKELAAIRDGRPAIVRNAAEMLKRTKNYAVQAWQKPKPPVETWMRGRPKLEIADWGGVQHGSSAYYIKDFSEKIAEKGLTQYEHLANKKIPGWPGLSKDNQLSIPNELLWMTVKGRMFVTDWHGLASLFEAKRAILGMFPWIDYVITGEAPLDSVPRS